MLPPSNRPFSLHRWRPVVVLLSAIGVAGAIAVGRFELGKDSGRIAAEPRKKGPVASAEDVRSNLWRIDVSDPETKRVIYVMQDGTKLRGWDAQVGKNANGNSSRGGWTSALDSWTFSPYVALGDGSNLQPFEVIEPKYRRRLALDGYRVTPTSVAALKTEVPLDVPPDDAIERSDYVREKGILGKDLIGPTVWYRGDILGVIDRATIQEVRSKNLHWPALIDRLSDKPPTGYWKVVFPSPTPFLTSAYHLDAGRVSEVRVEASIEKQLTISENGNRDYVRPTEAVSDWSLRVFEGMGAAPYRLTVNNAILDAEYLNDSKYRADARKRGFVIEPISKDEFDAFHNLKLTKPLAMALVVAERDREAGYRLQKPPVMAANSPSTTYYSGPIPSSRGTITINGKTSNIDYTGGSRIYQEPKFDEAKAKETIADQDRKLDQLAGDYALATVAERAAKKRAAGEYSQGLVDSQLNRSAIRQKIRNLERGYGLVPNGSYENPAGSEEFFKGVVKVEEAKFLGGQARSIEAGKLFEKGRISEVDRERAKELEAIELEKVTWLNHRSTSVPRAPSRLAPSPTVQAINRFEDQPIEVQVKDEDVRELFEGIFKDGQTPLTLDPAVQGRVSMTVKSVPRRIVLDTLCHSYGVAETVYNGHFTLARAQAN